jgi:hypothetical protein
MSTDGARHARQDPHALPPAVRAFLDGLAILIAEAIVEGHGAGAPARSENTSAAAIRSTKEP